MKAITALAFIILAANGFSYERMDIDKIESERRQWKKDIQSVSMDYVPPAPVDPYPPLNSMKVEHTIYNLPDGQTMSSTTWR